MWEVVVLLAGLLPDAEVAVAVTGLSTQIQTIPWMMCFSLGTATATRVAQALGAGDAARAAQLFRYNWLRHCTSVCFYVLSCLDWQARLASLGHSTSKHVWPL